MRRQMKDDLSPFFASEEERRRFEEEIRRRVRRGRVSYRSKVIEKEIPKHLVRGMAPSEGDLHGVSGFEIRPAFSTAIKVAAVLTVFCMILFLFVLIVYFGLL